MAVAGISGVEQLLKNINAAQVAARKAAEREVERARLAVETTAKKLINRGPKSGEVYKKYNPKRKHRASAPGEPPATDTGRLASAAESKKSNTELGKKGIQSKREGLTAVIWVELKYSKWLEFGTRDIEPRPFMQPAVDANKEKFPIALGNAVVESIDKAVKQ